MRQIVHQLDQIRQASRWLLVLQDLMQWLGALVIAGVGLGVIDFLLRLPGWLRLGIGLTVVVAALAWVIMRLPRAIRFYPSLAQLALRLERLYPKLRGRFASAVEFVANAERYQHPSRTAVLAEAAIRDAVLRLDGVRLLRLLNPRRTIRVLCDMLAAGLVLAALVAMAPGKAQIAATRWLAPLGAAQWPKRTQVVNYVQEKVWPTDGPVRLTAAVPRGYYDQMRVWARYRLLDVSGTAGSWQSMLMNEQSRELGVFERLVELSPAFIRAIETGGADTQAAIQFQFSAGDDTTDRAIVPLVARPAVRRVTAWLTPPEYAAGLINEHRLELHEQVTPIAAVSALIGSSVYLEVRMNKALERVTAEHTLPGFSEAMDFRHNHGDQFAASLTLGRTVQTQIHLVDRFGLTSLSERQYRIEAIEDQLPVVSIVQPSADESVLPTALLTVEALAQDDVGLEKLWIEADVPNLSNSRSEQTASPVILAHHQQRQVTLSVGAKLDLQPFELHSGQVVVLSATAQDVFNLAGARHDPVRSVPRRLRIIDEITFIGQIRSELAVVRQHAIRLERIQQQIMKVNPDRAVPQQAQLSRRLDNQRTMLDRMQRRAKMNRLNDPEIEELMDRARGEIEQSAKGSESAALGLQRQKPGQVRAAQQDVAEHLRNLIQLLDQRRDVVTLQLALRQLQTQQESIAQDTRQLLPLAVGQDRSSLPKELDRQIEQLAERQEALGGQAEQMIRQMQATSEALLHQGEQVRDQAAAEALEQAAAIAQRQGLTVKMRQASSATGQNQLSQAGQRQSEAMDTLRQMLSQIQRQDRLVAAILRRRLQELAEALEKLVQRQRDQIAVRKVTQDIMTLEPGQSAVRRSTMVAQEQAATGLATTQPVAAVIGDAVAAQAKAIVAMRERESAAAGVGQAAAVNSLTDALKTLKKLAREAKEEAAAQDRDALREAYEQLAKQQQQVQEPTDALVGMGVLTRKERSELVVLAEEQQQVRDGASKLGVQVEQTFIFRRLHDRIDESAGEVVSGLLLAEADQWLIAKQGQIVQLLQAMAGALDEKAQGGTFLEGDLNGGGGGGGGGGGQEGAVPPLAEVRLLKGIQLQINKTTRTLGELPAELMGANMKKRLTELAGQQREITELGQQLFNQLRSDKESLLKPILPPLPERELERSEQ